jgi:hypothetical protein
MADSKSRKRTVVHAAQKFVVNPIGRRMPVTMLETIGRKSGEPRRTAVGGRVIDNQFWMIAEHGDHSHYVLSKRTRPSGSGCMAAGAPGRLT